MPEHETTRTADEKRLALRVWMFRALQIGCAGMGGFVLQVAVIEASDVSCCLTIGRVLGALAMITLGAAMDERCMWPSREVNERQG